MLSQISDRLEVEVSKYNKIKEAIRIEDRDLEQIYDIKKEAQSLAALMEAHFKERQEFNEEYEYIQKRIIKIFLQRPMWFFPITGVGGLMSALFTLRFWQRKYSASPFTGIKDFSVGFAGIFSDRIIPPKQILPFLFLLRRRIEARINLASLARRSGPALLRG